MFPNKDRKKQPIGATSNIFAVASSHTQRQDHMHYKSLYSFNPDDLHEYSLPVLSDPKKFAGKNKKVSSGVVNSTKLAPVNEKGRSQAMEDMEGMEQYDMDGNQIIEEQEEMQGEQMEDEYDEEEEQPDLKHQTEDDMTYEDFKKLLEVQEEGTKNDIAEQRRANFLKKGSSIWLVQQAIKTGEQAISFFAKHGNNMPIKFVNCNRKQVKASDFRPYDLETVQDEKDLNIEYFTISAQGVIQVYESSEERRINDDLNNRTPTEFLSLSDWSTQSTMFNMLTSMKFFKNYLIGKIFKLWKGNVRYRTYNRTRLELSKQLIQARPDFMPKYLEINKILFEMQSKMTFEFNKNNKNQVDLNEFTESQKSHRDTQKQHYNEKVDDIITKNLITLVHELDQSRSLKEEEDLESTKMGQAAKHKSMVLVKEENRLKNQVLRLAKRNYNSLGTFIRLIDFMVVETQVRINQESTDQIYEEMTLDSTKKTQITTQISFANEGLSFTPDRQMFYNAFEKLLQEMLSVTEDITRVVSHQDLLPLVTGQMTDSGPKFTTIVDMSYEYSTKTRTILDTLQEDFEKLEELSKKWEDCRDIHEFEDSQEKDEFYKQNNQINQFKGQLEKIVKWQQLVNDKKKNESKGIIQMDAGRLKDQLSLCLKQEHIKLRQSAFEQGRALGDDIYKRYTTIDDNLNAQFSELLSYVTFMGNLTKAKEAQDQLAVDQKTLEGFKNLLNTAKFKIKDESQNSNLVFNGKPFQTSQSHHTELVKLIEGNADKQANLFKLISDKEAETLKEKEKYNEMLVARLNDQAAELEKYLDDINKNSDLNEAETLPEHALSELERIKKRADKTSTQIQTYLSYGQILGNPPMEMGIEDLFQKKYTTRYTLWKNRQDFGAMKKNWYTLSFKEQNAEQILEKVRQYNAQNNRIRMQDFAKDENDEVLEALTREVQSVREHSKLISALGNKAMLDKHWVQIYDKLGQPKPPKMQLDGTTLNQLITYGAENHVEEIEQISGTASGEKNINDTLTKVKNNWENTEFFVANYRESKDRFIIKQVEDVITLIEDDSMVVSTCMGSKFVTDIKDEVEEWEISLGYIGFLIDEWIGFQRQWMYLENIFNAADIQAQLKNETKKFQLVDKFWKDHMLKVKKEPRVMNYNDKGTLLKKFQENNAKLDEVTKALEDYLETKRAAFPRFYFLGNDELLEILSQTRNAQAVQPHLSKCFDSIKKIQFSEEKGSTEILGMWSAEGEYVAFSDSVQAIGPVEDWLGKIEKMMTQSLYDMTKRAFHEYPVDGTQRDEWLFNYAAQTVLTVDMVMWTAGVSHAIVEIQSGRENTALQTFYDFSERQLRGMIRLVRTKLTPLQRQMMGAMIVLDVHNRTVVEQMKGRVDNINHFDWTKQLRYYWEALTEKDGDPYKGNGNDFDTFCKQTNTRFRYGYEYLGNGPRLVITPLTDKCYMTLTGALHLYFGGNPQGPAGTGKTETTKDLAKAIAILCIVFNCSDGLDAKLMARYFVGLASSGAWSCFDEFNRINIEVLSVIGTQILTIQQAVRERKVQFEFEGQIIPLNFRFGVFITMNPGYAGRTELPDNLKALFRPVSMMIPDYRLIAEIILYSEGFEGAPNLAKKMVKLYSLSSEQLSKQDHYDFGMRAVKSVLVMAGQLKRKDVDGKEDENILLIRAMRDSNVPKFLEQDLGLFGGIITDLFPGIDVPPINYGLVQKTIESQLRNQKYQIKQSFITKIIQLLETMQVRHGNMVVGTTGTGKTTLTKTLSAALTQLHKDGHVDDWFKPVKIETLNPKAVTMGELFGEVNKFTNEWTDGIVSSLVLAAVTALEDENERIKKRWILFDGPVDALWIENMNTVLDDNKMLCLTNGQRIKMPETATMLFEVNDLRVASPATVSRCGMVYMEPVHLGWEPLIDTWYEQMTVQLIKESDEEKVKEAKEMYNEHCIIEPYLTDVKKILLEVCTKMIKVVRTQCKEMVQSVDSNLVSSCLKFISIFLKQERIKLNDTQTIQDPKRVVMTYVAFSIIWSLGANIHDSKRLVFSEYFRGEITKHFPEFPDGDVYELGLDEEKHELKHWNDLLVAQYEYNPKIQFFDILVPTSDTTKYKYLLNTLIQNNKHTLLIGETGVGKSVITKDFLMNIDESFVSTFVNFSGKTTTKNLQDAFEGNLQLKRKNLLAPEKSGKRMIFFIDDVNMPQLDKYFSQPPCELLRQTIDSGGFYDLKKLLLKYVKDVLFVSACGPPGGGRNPVSPRLFRHFNMIWVPELTPASMRVVFTSILKGYLGLNQTGSGLHMFAEQIIKGAVEIFQKSKEEFMPTPTKSHYTFNLRDLSKIIQGMLMCPNECIDEKEYLVKLYIHETYRVLRDRLTSEEDKSKFNDMSLAILENNLSLDWQIKDIQDVVFGDFEDNQRRNYQKMSQSKDLVDVLNIRLNTYNSEQTTGEMNLVFFDDCIQHLCRIARILRQQRGNAMLVGPGGSGRQSMAKLASSLVENMKNYSIEITKNYKEKDFQESIKDLLRQCGLDDNPIQFLFSDTQIMSENFLEDINNLLNSGEIPNLFPKDEKEAICDEITDKADKVGMGNDRANQYAFFVQQCRQKLHIVLTFSPVGVKFRERCRQFPSIINCTTIDWYLPWPEEALFTVAARQFTQNSEELNIKEQVEVLAKAACCLHSTVKDHSELYYEELRRRTYITPTSYLDLVSTFVELLKKAQQVIPAQINKYNSGIHRLEETNIIVNKLKEELILMIPQIEASEKETSIMVIELEKESEIAAQQEKINDQDAKAAQKIFNEVSEIKRECDTELGKALPALNAAIKALDTLKPADIGEMRGYAQPPKDLETLLQAVMHLLGEKGGWDEAKKLMAKPAEFILSLTGYDKDNIKEKILKGLKKYIQNPDLQPANIKKKSVAGESIAKWVFAMDTYAEVKKIVVPKEKALAEAKAKLSVVEKELNEKKSALEIVRKKIMQLQSKYKEKQLYLENLTAKKENNEVMLDRAKQLVEGLAHESSRWRDAIEDLVKDKANMVGNIVLASGYISYVGCFTKKYRTMLLNNWMSFLARNNVKFSPDFNVAKILGDPIVIRDWAIKGLPADQLSVDNGIIATKSKRWPLLIDPQEQGNKWIKNLERENGLQIIKLSNAKFMISVETAIRNGQSVILENIEETLDPQLEPVLSKNIVKRNGEDSIKLGNEYIPYSKDFKFFLTTKLANPHYLPEICIKVAIINFTVTPEGLEDQLLVEVVKYEQPELEAKKDELVVQLAEFKRQLKDIEAKILKLVAEASEDILNDEELIQTLDSSKTISTNLGERMEEAERIAEEIQKEREGYRGVAVRGSVLYFVIADLANINFMYQYSLSFFLKLFVLRLDKSKKAEILDERLKILTDDITISVYNSICRGLFEQDKLLFSFLNTSSILRRQSLISLDEWNFFLRGPANPKKTTSVVDYVDDATWNMLLGLEEAHDNFKGLTTSFNDPADKMTWKIIMREENPEKIQLPITFAEKLTAFQQLMLIKVIRKTKMINSIKLFINSTLGSTYIQSPPFNLDSVFNDSIPSTPIIFVLSPGADPYAYLYALAVEKGMKDKIKTISLGQGQDQKATKMIDEGSKTGLWICFQNCHLFTSWMGEFEKLLEKQDASLLHNDYRLWLTSDPSTSFPVPILQSGIKLTLEPPRGLKANMYRTFDDIGRERYEEACEKGREYRKLVFALAYFHSAILERRKYGAIGWNVTYQWMNSDFDCSERQLMMYLNEQPEVPYQALNYLVSLVNYGGRVTDDKDVRLIEAMLKKMFCPEIMSDAYKLSKLTTYYAPSDGSFDSAMKYISSLPLDEDPEVFGLHPNANIMYETNSVNLFIDTIILIQPRVSKGKGKEATPEELCRAKANEMQHLLPADLDKSKAHPVTFALNEQGTMNSLGVFCGQEIDRFNKLIQVIRLNLNLLDQALQGKVVMSQELENISNSFGNDKVPERWLDNTLGYPSLKPLLSWFTDLVKRFEFMREWLEQGPPISYWLPAFFFPQGFMTATLQTFARKTQTPIDTLSLRTNILPIYRKDVDHAPETGVNIHGLYMQGAKWDFTKKSVEDSDPKVAIVQFPVIWLEPIEDKDFIKDIKKYQCPLYKTSLRAGELSTTGHSTNFVLYIELPSNEYPDVWIRRGTALLCMTDD